jgi:hypothetical protein
LIARTAALLSLAFVSGCYVPWYLDAGGGVEAAFGDEVGGAAGYSVSFAFGLTFGSAERGTFSVGAGADADVLPVATGDRGALGLGGLHLRYDHTLRDNNPSTIRWTVMCNIGGGAFGVEDQTDPGGGIHCFTGPTYMLRSGAWLSFSVGPYGAVTSHPIGILGGQFHLAVMLNQDAP